MKNQEPKEYIIQGKKLKCQVCENSYFRTRKTLMNTVGLTFFNLDWANKRATNYICSNCDYIHWFML